MTLVSKADMAPPPYNLEPEVYPTNSQYEDKRYALRVETNVHQRTVDSGQFLTGTVTVHVLAEVNEQVNLSLTIWNKIQTYKKNHRFLSRRCTLNQSNMSKINRSLIPLTGSLKRGFSYTYPFSIQFPESSALPCCNCDGSIHSASPPSSNTGSVQVEYHLTSIVRHYSKRCWQSFCYRPTNLTLDLSNFSDSQGQSLMRKHTSLRSPRIAASAWPVINAPDQHSGYIRVYVKTSARISSVRTTIVQHTVSNPDGLGTVLVRNGSANTKQIGTSTLIGSWAPGVGQIDVPYELPQKAMPPSHVGCYSAVLYFFKVELMIDHEVCLLTLPFFQCRESTPEYPAPALPLKV